MSESSLFTKNFGKFDSLYSTYRHEIFLKNGATLVGYSKGLNMKELADKDTLLQKIIVRLFRNGYLHAKSKNTAKETLCIAFYKNDPVDPELIVMLYPKKYELAPEHLGNKLLISFLDRFYESVNTGSERNNMVKLPRKNDFLSIDVDFNSTAALMAYVYELEHKYGYSHHEAVKFYASWIKINGHKLKS